MLEVNELSAGYGRRQIVKNMTFCAKNGEILGILGANGSGKTTLLKSICGILPHTGSCLLDGQPLEGLRARQLARLCSYIPQRSGIGLDISALDVVLMGFNPVLGLLEYPSSLQKRAAREALTAVGLSGMEAVNYRTMSEGQKQLCILARTMVTEARLLLLDEPESALDFGGRYRVLELLRGWIRQRGSTAVVTLHDPQLALNCCDALLLVREGGCAALLRPGQDEARTLEAALQSLYGPLSLHSLPNRAGEAQWILLHD